MVATDTVVLARVPRLAAEDAVAEDWAEARSWFGGAPQLGSEPWPHDDAGVAPPFVAQINLADLAKACPGNPLPTSGAIFAGAVGLFL